MRKCSRCCSSVSEAIQKSSIYANTKSKPRVISSTNRIRIVFGRDRNLMVSTDEILKNLGHAVGSTCGGTVRAFNARWTPHGRRFSSFFGTTCRADAHRLFDGRIILCSIKCANSALICLSRSGARRRGLLQTGGPGVVSMWCTTPCRIFSHPKAGGRVRSGNSTKSRW